MGRLPSMQHCFEVTIEDLPGEKIVLGGLRVRLASMTVDLHGLFLRDLVKMARQAGLLCRLVLRKGRCHRRASSWLSQRISTMA